MTPLRKVKYNGPKKFKVQSASPRPDKRISECIIFGDPLQRLERINKEVQKNKSND